MSEYHVYQQAPYQPGPEAPKTLSPSAGEEDEKELTYPCFRKKRRCLATMDRYILFHYKQKLCGELRRWIEAAREKLTVAEDSIGIEHMDFYRINRTELEVHAVMTASCLRDGCDRPIRVQYVAKMLFSLTDRIYLLSYAFDDYPCPQPTDEKHCERIRLSKYLVPYMKSGYYDILTEKMLDKYDPEAFTEDCHNNPERLARNMGLDVVKLELNTRSIRSILYFRECEIVASRPHEHVRTRIAIEAGTVVINTAASEMFQPLTDDLFHECCHYEWHSMFFVLQNMYCDCYEICDNPSLTESMPEKLNDKEKKELEWIERHVGRGAFGLQLPQRVFVPIVQDYSRRLHRKDDHPGQLFERMILQISRDKILNPKLVRARMIQLGYPQAQGAINYDYDMKTYVPPFSFNLSESVPRSDFFISRIDFIRMYMRNEEFRKRVDLCKMIYVDGHLCVNDPKYIRCDDKGAHMTPEALARVDRCCLRFRKDYVPAAVYRYRHGEMYSDEKYNDKYYFYPPERYDDTHPRPTLAEQQLRNKAYLEHLPATVGECLTQLMHENHIPGVEDLAVRSALSHNTVARYLDSKYREYTAKSLTLLIIAMHVPPWLSLEIFKKAGFDLIGNDRLFHIRCTLETMFMDDIRDATAFMSVLEKKNFLTEIQAGNLI